MTYGFAILDYDRYADRDAANIHVNAPKAAVVEAVAAVLTACEGVTVRGNIVDVGSESHPMTFFSIRFPDTSADDEALQAQANDIAETVWRLAS